MRAAIRAGSSSTVLSGSRLQSRSCTFRPFTSVRPAPVRGTEQRQQRAVKVHFFKFQKSAKEEEACDHIITYTKRDDYTGEDVEDYFNYMGFLAEEGSYDRMEAMQATGQHPIDIILLLAASQDDLPKCQEVLKAGADVKAKDLDGKTPLQLTKKPELIDLLKQNGATACLVAVAV